MNQPPPDPNALTQPIPVVPQQPPPRPAPPPGAASGGPYVHRFGNVPFYLVSRLAAFFVDVFGIAFLIATFGFHAFEAGYLAYGSRNEAGFLSLAGISLGIAFGFAYLCEALLGTTIGKALFGLHTRAVDGRHAGGGRVFMRYLLRPVDLMAIGPFLALVAPRHRHLGDFAGGTVVSRSRFGALAPIAGIILLAGLGYAQIAYGGGITSAIEVAAEASNFTPDLIAKGAHALGLGSVPLPPVNVGSTPLPQTTPLPVSSAPLESPLPQAAPSDSPSDEPSDDAEPGAAPQPQPTERIINQ